ncbi:MAG: prepilin-type N-terminal cleavage/methylation domain-containing protein [Planctomycetota bacterium]|jgi:prepilin-type N-terminal cleavage/methylation domain-containing protein
MKAKSRQSGFTLTEMMVVIATIAVLAVFGVPAVRSFLHSFESRSGTKSMVQAALGSARAIAAKEQRYAGIRFQKAYNPEDPLNPFSETQYMVFIVQDPDMSAWGFRAVEGLKPIMLPKSVGVMDFTIVPDRNYTNPVNPWQFRIDDPGLTDAARDALINEPNVTDMSTFSIIFSPAGKLVVHGVQVLGRNAGDDVFNEDTQVNNGIGMFYEDRYDILGLGPEPSRNSFVIYDTKSFKQAYDKGLPWSDYLVTLVPEINYINAYTGTIISKD